MLPELKGYEHQDKHGEFAADLAYHLANGLGNLLNFNGDGGRSSTRPLDYFVPVILQKLTSFVCDE